MARVPLEELVLQIHLLGLGPAAGFLAGVIEPPPDRSITGAVAQLQGIGALTPDEAFTPLGAPAHMHAFLASTWGHLSLPCGQGHALMERHAGTDCPCGLPLSSRTYFHGLPYRH